jgi:hypothetical protein
MPGVRGLGHTVQEHQRLAGAGGYVMKANPIDDLTAVDDIIPFVVLYQMAH